jgi:hypothetical protein
MPVEPCCRNCYEYECVPSSSWRFLPRNWRHTVMTYSRTMNSAALKLFLTQ